MFSILSFFVVFVHSSNNEPQSQWSKTCGAYQGLAVIPTSDEGYATSGMNATFPTPTPMLSSNPNLSNIPTLSMPAEYINYTVSVVNGSLWATVDEHIQ